MKNFNGFNFFLLFAIISIGIFTGCQHLTAPESNNSLNNYIFPVSMKGYELYGWIEDGASYFTIITGTNRNKSASEIHSDDCLAAGNAWVKVKVKGFEALQSVAKQIPKGETIIWMGGLPDYPPISKELLLSIQKYFESLGLIFYAGS